MGKRPGQKNSCVGREQVTTGEQTGQSYANQHLAVKVTNSNGRAGERDAAGFALEV